MVSSCSAYGCTNRYVKGGGIKFHKFPTDIYFRKKWIIALKRKNFEPSRTAVVCSNHFTDNDYEMNVHGNKILKRDSIPSIFNFPQQCGKVLSEPRRVIERSSNSTTGDVSIDVNVEPEKQFPMLELPVGEVLSKASTSGNGQTKNISARKRKRTEPHYFGDFEEKDLENPSKRRRYWITSQKTVTLLREKVKYMQKKTKRMKNKIKTLQNLVEHLKNEKRISSNCSSLLKKYVVQFKDIHEYDTRNKNDIILEQKESRQGQNNVVFKGTVVYNKLPK